jgi:hypothetical protein
MRANLWLVQNGDNRLFLSPFHSERGGFVGGCHVSYAKMTVLRHSKLIISFLTLAVNYKQNKQACLLKAGIM